MRHDSASDPESRSTAAKPQVVRRRGRPRRSAPEVYGQLTSKDSVRTTVVMPTILDRNLAVLCARDGSTKSEVVNRVLFDYLEKQGFQPSKAPKGALY